MEPITLNWVCGEDDFLLTIGELEALDDLTRDGVLDYRYRLSKAQERGSFAYSPVRIQETVNAIRLGLIGGGMDRKEAAKKAKRALQDGDISELNLLAFTFITHSLSGKEHDLVGEGEAGAGSPQESNSPASTEMAQS